MNAPMPVAWIFILFLVLAAFGALAAIIWRSWIVGSIVLLFIFLIFGLYFVRAVPNQAPTMVMVQEATTPAQRWEPDAEILKTADVYPSLDEAAKNLAVRMCDNILLSQPPISPDHIYILSAKRDRTAEIVRDVFGEKYPNAVVVADDSHSGALAELMVTVKVVDSGKGKCVNLTANQNGRTFPSADACVKDAPWAADLDQYRSQNSKGDWIVGWSSMAEISLEAAHKQARQDAARQLIPFITARFPDLNLPNMDPNSLQSRLEQQLVHRRYINDTFDQKLRTPVRGQTVFRTGMLVDAGPAQLDKLHSSIIPEIHRQNRGVRLFGGGLVGMGVVICLVYLFLNRATRGYFQMDLRLGAFLVLVAGALLLMLVA